MYVRLCVYMYIYIYTRSGVCEWVYVYVCIYVVVGSLAFVDNIRTRAIVSIMQEPRICVCSAKITSENTSQHQLGKRRGTFFGRA